MNEEHFKKIISHAKEFGFIFPSSEIYDGLSATYDYGQNGVELKNNIKKYWWKSMVQMNENIVGVDSAIFMHPNTWKASGHNDAFNAAKSGWIRMKSNRACGFYDIIEPEKIMPEPDWPDMSFADMLQIAFNDDHIVDRDDHPALRRLKGGM